MYREGARAPQPFAGPSASAALGVEMADRKPLVAGNWKMNGSLPEVSDAGSLVVSFKPVWCICTGLTPTIAYIDEMHAAIRPRIPAGTRILYGGSVNPKNAGEILALDEVDGALVGGASLKAEDFLAIARACG